jgi:eukaryotic-like serine/threonine-protein kinase
MRDVLAALRIRLPGSHRAALLHSVVLRARLVIRGLDAVLPGALDPEAELRMDALWMASTSLAHVNYALADVLLLHHVRAALDGGSPSRLMRSLSYEAAAEVTLGSAYFDRRASRLMARAEQLLDPRNDYDLAWFQVSCAAIAFFRAQWRDTIAHAEAAEHHFLRHGIGVAWERAVIHSYWLFALALTGDAAALDARRRIALADALARRDQLAESQARSGYTLLAWLFRDDVAGARRERSTILGAVHRDHRERAGANRWPESSFGTPDYHALLADCHVDLYAGDDAAACARIETAWPLVERALLLRIQFVGVDLRFLRARCALAASRTARDRPALIKLAIRERTRIARDPSPVAHPYHALLGGLIGPAPDLLDAAARGFDDLAMAAHAAAARFRRGELEGGRAGEQQCATAIDRLRGLGIARPERIVDMYAPRTAP